MLYSRLFAVILVFAVDLRNTFALDSTVPATDVTTESNVMASQSCVTGKGVAGTCVRREKCDYGTAAIDFSLFRPKGYTLSCTAGEDICCPPHYLVQQEDRTWVPQNGEFDFDDDD